MGSHTDSGQVSRLEVVETGRRRRWSISERLRIVEESFAGPRRVSETARRNEVSRSLLGTWRRLYHQGRLGAEPTPGFAPMIVTPGAPSSLTAEQEAGRDEAAPIEMVLTNGRRLRVSPTVDATALARIVGALERA